MCRSCCCFPWRWNHIQRRQSHLTWSDKKLCCHSCQYLWGHHDTLQVKFLSFHKNMELPDLLWNYDRQTDWRTDPLTKLTDQPTDRPTEWWTWGSREPLTLMCCRLVVGLLIDLLRKRIFVVASVIILAYVLAHTFSDFFPSFRLVKIC